MLNMESNSATKLAKKRKKSSRDDVASAGKKNKKKNASGGDRVEVAQVTGSEDQTPADDESVERIEIRGIEDFVESDDAGGSGAEKGSSLSSEGQPGLKDKMASKTTKMKKKKKPGVLYLASVPRTLTVAQLRSFMSQFGTVGRIFLQPDGKLTDNDVNLSKMSSLPASYLIDSQIHFACSFLSLNRCHLTIPVYFISLSLCFLITFLLF